MRNDELQQQLGIYIVAIDSEIAIATAQISQSGHCESGHCSNLIW